jgi:hypothetical protein
MIITIKDGKAEATRIFWKRLFWDWDFSVRESDIVAEIDKLLGTSNK